MEYLIRIFSYCSLRVPLTGFLFPAVFILFMQQGRAQAIEKTDTISVQNIRTASYIEDYTTFYTHPRQEEPIPSIQNIPFVPRKNFLKNTVLPPKYVDRDVYLKFTLRNHADTSERVYFFPSLYYKKIEVLQAGSNGNLIPIPDTASRRAPDSHREGFRRITIPADTAITYVVRLQAVRTSINTLDPKLVASHYVPVLITLSRQQGGDLNMFGYLFSGLLLLMVLYSLTNYVQTFNPEFLSYAIYTFCMGLLMFLKTYFYNFSHPFNYFFEGYLDFIIQGCGILFYLMFLNQFLQSKEKYPLMYRVLTTAQAVILVSLFLFSYAHFRMDNYEMEFNIENGIKYILLGVGVFFILYGLRVKDKLMRYLVWGNIALIVFAAFSLLMIIFRINFKGVPKVFNQSLFYYELGLVIELICFLAGLSYKNRKELIQRTREREKLRLENERKELEKQMAVYVAQQEERNRISTDMHDELGSGMTTIRLLSELAKNKLRENPLPEVEKISASANDLLNKMNAIIWSMNSSNDTLENLVAYIRSYSLEYFEGSEIDCHISTPVSLPQQEISGEKRRNIFLCVKESLHNIIKHAQCTKVDMQISINSNILIVQIYDNGVGIDMDKLRQFGNGLVNMKRRMNSISGQYDIQRRDGTVTRLTLPL